MTDPRASRPSSLGSRRPVRATALFLITAAAVAAVVIGWPHFFSAQPTIRHSPAPADETVTLAPPTERPAVSRLARQPEAADVIDAADRVRQERLARDPERIEAAERILGDFENLFLDATALEDIEPGDIRGGMAPSSLHQRRIALAALDVAIGHAENAGPIRDRSVRVLELLVRQPWPTLATPEADHFVLQERGHALASLLKVAPDSAASAYRGISDRNIQRRVATRAVHLLVRGGMPKDEANLRVTELSSR